MALVDLVMPKLGESIMEATILKWHKQPGDTVAQDETVLEIATDKVDSEVPSTAAGVIESLLFNVNDVVPIGTVIARIRTGAAESIQSAPTHSTPVVPPVTPPSVPTTAISTSISTTPATSIATGRFYSPLVLNIATSEGIGLAELETLPGSGNEGRVTKKDILEYVAKRKQQGPLTPSSAPQVATVISTNIGSTELTIPLSKIEPTSASSLPVTYAGNVEIVEMDRMRKLIADHMVRSKQTSPHVTSFTEADVTNLVLWRERVKKEFEKGRRLRSPLLLFLLRRSYDA